MIQSPQTQSPVKRGRSAAKPVQDSATLLKEAVSEALEEAGGNVQEAAKILSDMGNTSIALRDAINKDSYFENCLKHVSIANRSNNARRWSPPAADPIPSAATAPTRSATLAATNRRRAEAYADEIMMTTLPGGGYLKDATRADLLTAQDFYVKQGTTMMMKGRWMGMIAKLVDGRKKVGGTITAQTLRKLQEDAQNA